MFYDREKGEREELMMKKSIFGKIEFPLLLAFPQPFTTISLDPQIVILPFLHQFHLQSMSLCP